MDPLPGVRSVPDWVKCLCAKMKTLVMRTRSYGVPSPTRINVSLLITIVLHLNAFQCPVQTDYCSCGFYAAYLPYKLLSYMNSPIHTSRQRGSFTPNGNEWWEGIDTESMRRQANELAKRFAYGVSYYEIPSVLTRSDCCQTPSPMQPASNVSPGYEFILPPHVVTGDNGRSQYALWLYAYRTCTLSESQMKKINTGCPLFYAIARRGATGVLRRITQPDSNPVVQINVE